MFRKISIYLKECALKLWDRGWDVEDIKDALGMSVSSIYRWRRIFDEHGTVNRPSYRPKGPDRILTADVLAAIQELHERDSDLYLDELVLWLAIEHNIAISITALHETLERLNLTRKKLHKIALERDDVLRAEWRATVLESEDFLPDGSQFVFVDETSENDHTYARRYGRAYSGQRAELKDVFVRGDRYSLVAALAKEGYIAADVIPGSYDALDFLEFIQDKLLPQMNPYPDRRSVLVLDNCRIHHNEALVNLVKAAGCLILYLPPYSPDLNPIEESFSALKAYIRRNGFVIRREEDAVMALLEACGCITPQAAEGWFRHAGYIH